MPSDDLVTFAIEYCEDIESAKHFVTAVFDLRASIKNRKLWYRGHSDFVYKLIPTVGRKRVYAGQPVKLRRDQEISLLHRFRRRAHPHVGRAMTAGEAIFLARHHGLPTRLLDWTANALFALYFACVADPEENQKKDGRVWAMLPRKGTNDLDAFDLARQEDESKLFNYLVTRNGRTRHLGDPSDVIKMVHPFYNSPRLLAQDGAFTIHSNPWRSVDKSYKGEQFAKENLDIKVLYSWRVPGKNKVDIIKGLSGLGITHRTVFPDLDGVARSLWETEVLWSGVRD